MGGYFAYTDEAGGTILSSRPWTFSLATRLFIFLFVSSVLLFMSLAYYNLNKAEAIYKNQMIHDWVIILNRTEDYINLYFDNIQNILLLLSVREELFVSTDRQLVVSDLRNYAELNGHIVSSLFIVRADGEVFSNEQVYYEILGHPQLSELQQLAQGNYGGINWSEPYYSPLSHNTIAFVRPVHHSNGQFLGTIVLEIDLHALMTTMSSLSVSKYQTFLMLSPDGQPILVPAQNRLLPYEPGTYPAQIDEPFLQRLHAVGSYVETVQGPAGSLLAMKSSRNRLGWQFIGLIDEQNIIEQNVQLLQTSYRNAMFVWLIILFFTSVFISRYFSSPIKMLMRKMDRVNNVQLASEVRMNRNDEIGELASSFNAMMKRIKTLTSELLQSEKHKQEYEIQMLQNQINPHFLYNTLACINSLAYQQKLQDVQNTIGNLTGLLSIVMEKNTVFTSLQREIEGLRMYLDIQNIRYGNKVNCSIELDEHLLRCQLPRLTLQPIVENAIFHGIVPTRRTGHISIYGHMKRGNLIIYVRDNGIGMDRETVQRIVNGLEQKQGEYHFTGMGLHNVHHRLRLYYGPRFGLTIRSKLHAGTIVKITVKAATDNYNEQLP